ncbi:MAG: mngB [Vampirovibrio sp.]|jgi:hypothetical protein|nr:mngB [Vampirovibrio sp.]
MSQSGQQSSESGQLAVYYHTHWDREWYLPFRSYQVRLAEVVDEVLERLERGILPCFMLDGQTVVLEDYLELRPENRERLQRLVLDGQLSIGPWFVMPDEFLVGGESLIRNLARGIRESRAWGCYQFTGYLPDTFGHSADMPTILKHCGIDSSVVWRGVHPQKSLFQWQSPSGASVLSLHLTDGYFQMMLHDWTATKVQQAEALDALVEKLEAARLSEGAALLPIGGDHLAPVTQAGHALLRERYPHLNETTPEKFLSDIRTNVPLQTVQGELIDNTGSFLLPGVYASRMYLRQANRRLEHFLTRKLEPLLAMAQVLLPQGTFSYPVHELDLAWKTLMLNHPHDSICGCSVDAVHRENEVRFDQVAQFGEAMLERAVNRLAAQLAGPDEWLVFNTTERPYTGVVAVVEDVSDAESPSNFPNLPGQTVLQDEYLHDPHRIPLSHLTKLRRVGYKWVEKVPAFGYQTVAKGKELPSPVAPVQAERNRLENDVLSVRVEGDGSLTVTDKRTGQKYANLMAFTLRPDQGDSYNSAPVPGQPAVKFEFLGCQQAQCIDGLKGQISLGYCYTEHKEGYALNFTLGTTISLMAGSPLLTFETAFSNPSAPSHKLQVTFQTSQPVASVLAESHLGTVTRQYDPAYRIQDHMPVEKMKELKTNTGPIQRFISANGQSWITEGLTEYEVFKNTVAITLMRSFQAISKADTGVRGAQAGPPFATPEGGCLNRYTVCHYAWTPTPGESSELFHLAAAWYGQPKPGESYGSIWALSGRGASPDTKQAVASLIFWDCPTLVNSACYWVPGKGLVLRVMNPSEQSVTAMFTAGFAYKAMSEVNFLEEPIQAMSEPQVTVRAHDVKTLLFEV